MSGLLRVPHPHVEVQDVGALVKGTRVPVRRLWSWHQRGISAASRARSSGGGIRGSLDALSFAYDNPELMDAELADERSRLNEMDTRKP